jgi:hypothetical protein
MALVRQGSVHQKPLQVEPWAVQSLLRRHGSPMRPPPSSSVVSGGESEGMVTSPPSDPPLELPELVEPLELPELASIATSSPPPSDPSGAEPTA